MSTPETAFRKETRSHDHPHGIKLKDFPHTHREAVELLKSAREGVQFEVEEGCVRPMNTREKLRVVGCQPYDVWGMYPDDKNLVLEVQVTNEPLNPWQTIYEEPDPSQCQQLLLVDEEFGRNLAYLDEQSLNFMLTVLPQYIQEMFDDGKFIISQNAEGVFLERK